MRVCAGVRAVKSSGSQARRTPTVIRYGRRRGTMEREPAISLRVLVADGVDERHEALRLAGAATGHDVRPRHASLEDASFEMLRRHARDTESKLVDVADIVIRGYRLLPADARRPASESSDSPDSGPR